MAQNKTLEYALKVYNKEITLPDVPYKFVKPVSDALNAPNSIFLFYQSQLLNKIDSYIAKKYVSGLTSNAKGSPHTYDTDIETQRSFSDMAVISKSENFINHPVYQGKININCYVGDATMKTRVPHNAAEIQQLYEDWLAMYDTIKNECWKLKDAAYAASSIEELNRIVKQIN